MDYMMKLKDMLCEELEEYASRKSLSTSDLDMIHKLTDAIKNIDKIEKLEDNVGHSERYPYDRGSSYARQGTHYVKGHYSRDDGGRDYSERYDRRYSRDEAKDHMMSKLGEMMEDATPNEREVLKHAMRKLEDT